MILTLNGDPSLFLFFGLAVIIRSFYLKNRQEGAAGAKGALARQFPASYMEEYLLLQRLLHLSSSIIAPSHRLRIAAALDELHASVDELHAAVDELGQVFGTEVRLSGINLMHPECVKTLCKQLRIQLKELLESKVSDADLQVALREIVDKSGMESSSFIAQKVSSDHRPGEEEGYRLGLRSPVDPVDPVDLVDPVDPVNLGGLHTREMLRREACESTLATAELATAVSANTKPTSATHNQEINIFDCVMPRRRHGAESFGECLTLDSLQDSDYAIAKDGDCAIAKESITISSPPYTSMCSTHSESSYNLRSSDGRRSPLVTPYEEVTEDAPSERAEALAFSCSHRAGKENSPQREESDQVLESTRVAAAARRCPRPSRIYQLYSPESAGDILILGELLKRRF